MHIAVLAKVVPDTYGKRSLNLETGLVDRADGDVVLDEICERAIEAALQLDGEHTIELVSMGSEDSVAALRKGLAMGGDEAVMVTDEQLLGADLGVTARVLAAVIDKRGYDLVLTGNESTDGASGMLPAMLAEHLDAALLTGLTTLTVDGESVSGERTTDYGSATVTAQTRAVVSITEAFPDPRYPNFKGIMAAKKKPLTTLTAADLGVDPEDFSYPLAIMTDVAAAPPRAAGTKITDDGTAAEQLVSYLVDNKLV